MQLSAETRWFWRGNAPPGLENWFRSSDRHGFVAGGGGRDLRDPREDRYLHDDSQIELGIKLRGTDAASSKGVEVKGLVVAALGDLATESFKGPIELWCKWRSQSLSMGSTVAIQKWRCVRKFDTTGVAPVEIALGSDENHVTSGIAQPMRGCIVEFTEIHVPANKQTWWIFGFEAFGTISTVENDLRAVAVVLDDRQPPRLDGGLLASYPAWLKGQVLPILS